VTFGKLQCLNEQIQTAWLKVNFVFHFIQLLIRVKKMRTLDLLGLVISERKNDLKNDLHFCMLEGCNG